MLYNQLNQLFNPELLFYPKIPQNQGIYFYQNCLCSGAFFIFKEGAKVTIS